MNSDTQIISFPVFEAIPHKIIITTFSALIPVVSEAGILAGAASYSLIFLCQPAIILSL